jgi:sulfide dehydrogenase cytochrome subunit
MNVSTHRRLLLGIVAAVAIGVGSATTPSSAAVPPETLAAVSATSLVQHPGKILAGNCFQCHGTNGINGQFDSLAGESATELYQELKEMQRKTDGDEAIMKVHALGYTDAQLQLIAAYFAAVTGR